MSNPIDDPRLRCRACSKPLKDPASVERGFGPVCWKRAHIKPRQTGQRAKTEGPVDMQPGMATEREKRGLCRRCGRLLKSEEPIRAGIGPASSARALKVKGTRAKKGEICHDPNQLEMFPDEFTLVPYLERRCSLPDRT